MSLDLAPSKAVAELQQVKARADTLLADFEVSDSILDAATALRQAFDKDILVRGKEQAETLSNSIQALQQIARYDIPVDMISEGYQLVNLVQDRLLFIIQATPELRGTSNPAVLQILEDMQKAAKIAFDETENVRWALMNAEAEADIEAGNAKSFGSMDAALAYLARQR